MQGALLCVKVTVSECAQLVPDPGGEIEFYPFSNGQLICDSQVF